MEGINNTPPQSPPAEVSGDEFEVLSSSTPPPLTAPTSPSTTTPRQLILRYSQNYQPNSDEPPRAFFDPNTWFNEYSFTLESNQEYIILIEAREGENYIYQAILNHANSPMEVQDASVLCVMLRLDSPGINLTVAARTSLAFLMQNASVSARLCYINHFVDYCLHQDHNYHIPAAKTLPDCNFLTTYAEPTFPPLAQQVAARNPLLLRRLRTLPQISSLAMKPLAE